MTITKNGKQTKTTGAVCQMISTYWPPDTLHIIQVTTVCS